MSTASTPDCQGGGAVDAANPGMRLAAPDEHGMQQAREVQVVDEPPPAAQQRRVLDPGDRLAERARTAAAHGLTQPPST